MLSFPGRSICRHGSLITRRNYSDYASQPTWHRSPILKGTNPGKLPPLQDARRIQISKTMSYLLRRDGGEGIGVSSDGFVPVSTLLSHPLMRGVSFSALEMIVKMDKTNRFALLHKTASSDQVASWWIRANQGHSLPVQTDMRRLTSASEIPMAVHGTNEQAWQIISSEGLSRMGQDYIHMGREVAVEGVVNGIRNNSRILIYVDVEKALSSGIVFYLSQNGLVLSPGNELGFIEPRFFERVDKVSRNIQEFTGWRSSGSDPSVAESSTIR